MSWLRRLLLPRSREQREKDLERELLADLEQEAEEQQHGLTPEEVKWAARRALGNLTRVREDVRAEWRWTSLLDRLEQDLRFALRTARKNPIYTLTAVATLALGIGVNTAVFSVVHTVLLRKPPYADPDRLVQVRQKFPKLGGGGLGASPAEFLDYRDRTRTLATVAGYEPAVFDLTTDDPSKEPAHIQALRVSHDLFSTLGVTPKRGRTFTKAEDVEGANRVAILSHEMWQRRFGGDLQAIGATIRLNEQPYTIIGVMPEGFEFPFNAASVGEPPVLWTPMGLTQQRIRDRGADFPIRIIGRLKPGASIDQAAQDISSIAAMFPKEHPELYRGNLHLEATVEVFGEGETARARPVLLAITGAVLFVLLIACANVMNLQLARAASRQREIAVRNALGASKGRLLVQLLTEGLFLALTGALLGTGLAFLLIRLAAKMWPSFVAGLSQAKLDWSVLTFTLAVSILTGIVCGLAPALQRDLGDAIRHAGRSGGGSQKRHGLRSALVVIEAGSAVVLLIGAGLLIHSLINVWRVPMGFSPDGVTITRTAFNRQRYPSNEPRHVAEREIEQRLAAIPGVEAVGLATHIPLADDRKIGYKLEGADIASIGWADHALVSGGYFAAMRIPILHGRTFGPEDTPNAPITAIINESMARQFWPDGSAIGRRLLWGGRRLTIVGIAGDVHVSALDSGAVQPTIYNSVYQVESAATTSAVFVLRASRDGGNLAASIRQAIWSVDHGIPVFDIRSMGQIIARSLETRHFAVGLLTAFATLALVLAVIGLYGVLSYAVAQRTAELGMRLALGATSGQVLRLVMSDGVRLSVIGVALGAVVGALAARGLSKLLFGVGSFDPLAFGLAAAVLVGMSMLASYLPARRAARVDPIVALRHE
jgi:predicted permease